jgi:hypothetical protein
MIDRQASIALLREELEQQRTRAEAAEADLRELRKAMVDAVEIIDECYAALWSHEELTPTKRGEIAARIGIWRRS